jgi:ribonuclease R
VVIRVGYAIALERARKPSTPTEQAREVSDPARWLSTNSTQFTLRDRMPIPNRQHILELLERGGAPLTLDAIAEQFRVSQGAQHKELFRVLRAMEKNGDLLRNRAGEYGLTERMDLVRGRVIAHRDGYGFLVPDEGGADLFLAPRQMRAIMHGDRVVGRTVGIDGRGRREGAVVEVLERSVHQVVGRYMQEAGAGWVVADDARIRHDILVPSDARLGAAVGDIVVAQITEHPQKHQRAQGRIVEVMGAHMAPGMEVDIAIRAHELPAEFPAAVTIEAAKFGTSVKAAAKRGREDLRELALVTIDGADARDFDDAVHCRATPSGWKLTVAIADVAAYVKAGSALDVEATQRGNSVYFPGRVIPMLPEELSNGLCSLRPDEDRLCMVCEMLVSKTGAVTRTRFFEGLMRSHARLTYEEMSTIVEVRDRVARKARAPLLPHLDELYKVFKALVRARKRRGALELDTQETRVVLDAQGKVAHVAPVQRNDAHRIIEECMVAANVAAARFVIKHKTAALFRIHDGAKADGLDTLRTYLANIGLTLPGGSKPEPKHYLSLLTKANARPDGALIQVMVLRSLSQAVYSPDNIGHFGLALEMYAHFTSPIRRYADLLLHRALKSIIKGRRRAPYGYSHEQLVSLGEHVSMTERRADDATREALSWLKCEYMLDKVGQEFAGTVTGVAGFGLFVILDELHVEGLAHVSSLGQDYFHFDPARQVLQGERSKEAFGVGDRLRVKVARVDLDERKVDFERVGGERTKQPAHNRSKARKGKGGDPHGAGNRGGRAEKSGRPKSRRGRK